MNQLPLPGKTCLSFAFVILLLTGCGGETKSLPETFTAKGRLVDAAGSPLTDGMISFQSPDNAEHSSQAEVQADGNFQLFTLIEGERLEGARPGDYRVTYFPRMSAAQTEMPVVLDEPFTVKSGENVFEIKLEEK